MSHQATTDPVLLDATLRPSPPMRPAALLVVLVIVALINAGFAFYFIAHGAWPVMPFMGMDLLLLGWAFRQSSRMARRFEQVTVTPAELRVAAHPVRGAPVETVFNPYWVRVDLPEPVEHGSNLLLRSHGHVMEVGRFLAPSERADFGHALKSALNRARNFR